MRGGRASWSCLFNITLQALNLRTEITSPEKLSAVSVYKCKSKLQLVDYHHASCWSPVKSTWVKAISNIFFTFWPGLSKAMVNQYLVKKEATILGHLRQTRQGITKPQTPTPDLNAESDFFPPSSNSSILDNIFFKVVELNGKIYTDQNQLVFSHIQWRKKVHFSGVSLRL